MTPRRSGRVQGINERSSTHHIGGVEETPDERKEDATEEV
jgi:hypothetical protein